MKTGSYFAKKPFGLAISGAGLGVFLIIGSNAEIVYFEK